MMKILISMVAGIFISTGCSSPKLNRYETMAYQVASPENKLKIEQGVIGEDMSIEECKISCPECQFIRKFTSKDGSYELWKVNDGPERNLYLHVVNSRIKKILKSEVQTPQDKRTRPQKHQ
jgi:hypothetical protein